MEYVVVRPFADKQPGHRLTEADFVRPERIRQLEQQRFIKAVATSAGLQPTSDLLVNSTLARLRELISSVVDSGVIEAAMLQDTRDGAKKVYELRLGELRGAN